MSKRITFLLTLCMAVVAVTWIARALRSEPEASSTTTLPLQRPPSPSVPSPASPTLVLARPLEVPADGYLGSNACKKCHHEHHQSWHHSYHRTMTQVISPESAPSAIENTSVRVEDLSYVFNRREDDFFVEFNDPIANGARRERRLVMMTGSHHMHVFWYASGVPGTPAQLPIVYLRDEERWIPRRSAFLGPTDSMPHNSELGRWNTACSRCHSTHPRQRPNVAAQTWDTQVSDFGIACEACHGPGQGHVQFHVSEGAANVVDSIVHPLKLPAESRSDLCGQCHGVAVYDFSGSGLADYLAHGSPYRPGQVLNETHFHTIVRASPEDRESDTFARWNKDPEMLPSHFWPDGEVRISGRDYNGMIESSCYEQGDLSCMSCHTMHQQDLGLQQTWKDDQLKPQMRGDVACLQCHPKYEALGTAHTHHPIESSGSRCMNCHMPHTVYGLLKTIRSHTISSPLVSSTLQTGRPNACSLCHLDQTLEQTSGHLAAWYGQSQPELTEEERNTAASVLHFLTGDAAQRVLQIAAFQWQPARDTSGTDWMRPYLLIGMDDPYEAIRLISHRGYKSLYGSQSFQYDFLALPIERKALLARESEKIRSEATLKPSAALLIDEKGELDEARVNELIGNRNHRRVFLLE